MNSKAHANHSCNEQGTGMVEVDRRLPPTPTRSVHGLDGRG
jgi:hypothetical protein